MRELWNSQPAGSDISTDAAYECLQRAISAPQSVIRRPFYLSARRMARSAAVILIPLLSIAGAWWWTANHAAQPLEYVECFVPNGTTRTVTLPDSTRVTLNAGSVLIYPNKFTADKRDVYLNGEAAFKVERDERRPFTVRTCDINVTVLGTEFNVSAYADAASSSATLREGSVRVNDTSGSEEILASEGEQLYYDRAEGRSEKRMVDPAAAFAWQQRNMFFAHSNVHDIISTVERHYGVKVYLSSSRFDEAVITAKFVNGETVDEFLRVFADLIPGMRYRVENENVYLY